jgi:hypothetical protein
MGRNDRQFSFDTKRLAQKTNRPTILVLLLMYSLPGIPMKLVKLIKMCLNETYSKVRIGKYLSDKFPIQNGLKQEDALLQLFFIVALQHTIRKVQENQVGLKLNGMPMM